MQKEEQLLQLAKKRQSYNLDSFNKEYKNIGDYHNGIYECDYVSPYSKSAHNTDADIMIYLQDWSSDNSLSGTICDESKDKGYTPSLPTNENLKSLLEEHFKIHLEDTYATNLFPFIKMGNMSSHIPVQDMKLAAIEFGFPQIDIIKPKIVICLGLSTFNALRRANGLRACKNLNEAISLPFKYNSTYIYCQSHTGKLGKNNRNRGGKDRVTDDWKKMYEEFNN